MRQGSDSRRTSLTRMENRRYSLLREYLIEVVRALFEKGVLNPKDPIHIILPRVFVEVKKDMLSDIRSIIGEVVTAATPIAIKKANDSMKNIVDKIIFDLFKS